MAYTLSNTCAKNLCTGTVDGSSSTYHQKRGHMFLEHSVDRFLDQDLNPWSLGFCVEDYGYRWRRV